MSEQLNFDNIIFPVPEVPKFYLVEFHEFHVRDGTYKVEKIAGQYIAEKDLDMIEPIAEGYFKLFRQWIYIEIKEKKEDRDD